MRQRIDAFMRKLRKQEQVVLVMVFLIVTILNLIVTMTHESWRDEAQAWLIAGEHSPFSLLDMLSFEGHPCLWYYFLMPFAKLGASYAVIKLISLGIMTVVIAMILFCSPLDIFSKIWIVLSPACIYYYPSISRSYCLCALFTVLAAILHKEKFKNKVTYGICIALMLQTHIIMAGFAAALCLEYLLEALSDWRKNGKMVRLLQKISVLLIPVSSGVLLLYEFRDVMQAQDYGGEVSVSWIPLVCGAVIMLVLLTAGLWLKKKKVIKWKAFHSILLLSVGIVWQTLVYGLIYPWSEQKLFTWIYLLIWAVWTVLDSEKEWNVLRLAIGKYRMSLLQATNLGFFLLGAMLSLLFGRGIWQDMTQLYSDAKAVAAAVEALPEDAVIFEGQEDYCNAIIPYLEDKVMYNPFSEQPAGYCNRDENMRHSMNYEEFLQTCKKMFPDVEGVYIVYANDTSQITGLIEATETISPIYQTQNPTLENENFTLKYISFVP